MIDEKMKSIKFFSVCALMALGLGVSGLKAQEKQDSTIVYNNVVSRSNGIWNLNFLSISTDGYRCNVRPHSHHYADLGPQDIYLAYAGIGNTEGFEQKVAHSLEFGFNFGRIQHWNASRTVGLQASIGLSWNRYSTQDNAVFQVDKDGELFCAPWEDAPKRYSRARMTYVSWRVPVMLQFQDRRKLNCFSVGVEGELRHHIRSRVRMGGKKRYDVLRDGLCVNPWGLNIIARYDFDDFGIFGRYAVTPFFDESKTSFEGTPFAVGIVFNFD